jgi:hypothetical protein
MEFDDYEINLMSETSENFENQSLRYSIPLLNGEDRDFKSPL